jgi:hypothetical protein
MGTMKIGDRVVLSDQVAKNWAAHKDWRCSRTVDWFNRQGTVKKISAAGRAGVLWDGRTSLDWWPVEKFRVLP